MDGYAPVDTKDETDREPERINYFEKLNRYEKPPSIIKSEEVFDNPAPAERSTTKLLLTKYFAPPSK